MHLIFASSIVTKLNTHENLDLPITKFHL